MHVKAVKQDAGQGALDDSHESSYNIIHDVYFYMCTHTYIHISHIYIYNVIYVYIYADRRSHQRYIMMTLNILLLAHMN